MKLLDNLSEIDQNDAFAYIIHEKFERNFDQHQHQKGQFSFVEDGIAYLTIDNKHYLVPAKHFFWIPANIPHQLRVSHSATQLHSMYIQPMEGSFFQNFGIYPANNLIIHLIKFTERWSQQFVNLDQPFTSVLKTLFEVITLQKDSLYIKLPIANSNIMESIVNYIQTNYSKPLHLKDMTERFNMSERSFCRLFKKELNITFLQYLKTFRVITAIDLLAKTNKSIYDIANEVGYESISSFSNVFLDYTNKRPQEMRNYILK